MTIERVLVVIYLLACVLVGIVFSLRSQDSSEEYWVAGRRIGPWVNAMAIMAALASGGSIVGVMGYAYSLGIPTTLSLFAGAILGFPLASVLVAAPLRRFGKFTITDFMSWRYPHPVIRIGVPLLIVVSFTMYIVAQMSVAGTTSEALLGIPYRQSLALATVIFILYVSIGGMLAITWTDVIQGTLMIIVVVGTAIWLMVKYGGPQEVLTSGMAAAPELGNVGGTVKGNWVTGLGAFVIWSAAIPIIPHVVMRVFTAKDPHSARLSLNLAMIAYAIIILAAVMIIVPVSKVLFPELEKSDEVFLRIMETEFSPAVRGVAVAAVLAAVMSTTDGLLLACSSAISHDIVANYWGTRLSQSSINRVNIVVVWIIGLIAMVMAFSRPKLVTGYYTDAIGALSAGLFIPVIAGLWWKRANLSGGVLSFVAGVGTYLIAFTMTQMNEAVYPKRSAILIALPASLLAMLIGSLLGRVDDQEKLDSVSQLHGSPLP